MDHDSNRRTAAEQKLGAAITEYIDRVVETRISDALANAAAKGARKYTARDIKSTETSPSPGRFGYIVRATTHDGKVVEVEARDLLNSPHDALTLVLDKLNEAPQ